MTATWQQTLRFFQMWVKVSLKVDQGVKLAGFFTPGRFLCLFRSRWAPATAETRGPVVEQGGPGSDLGHPTVGPRAYEGVPHVGVPRIHHQSLWKELLAESAAPIWQPAEGHREQHCFQPSKMSQHMSQQVASSLSFHLMAFLFKWRLNLMSFCHFPSPSCSPTTCIANSWGPWPHFFCLVAMSLVVCKDKKHVTIGMVGYPNVGTLANLEREKQDPDDPHCLGTALVRGFHQVKAQISPPNRKANENSGRSKVGKAFEHRFGMFGVGVFRKGLGGEVALESKPKPFNFQIC